MHVLHVTAHLGGGVGKAHAALRAAMPADVRETYLLLETPRDRRYADEIARHGGEIIFARDLAHVAERAGSADIVQFEFWNHPKLFECLARTTFPPIRSVFWSHVSGLFKPVIAPGFLTAVDRFVFTTPASMVLGRGLPADQQAGLSAIGSGFGFSAVSSVALPSGLPGICPSRGENGWSTVPPRSFVASPTFDGSLGQRAGRLPISPPEGRAIAFGKTPSGLPAISPTRGEKTRGTLPPKSAPRRRGRLSPSPLWGGVGEGFSAKCNWPAPEGEMPGRAEGGSQTLNTRYPITYLGTVDFVKMHPGFFDAVDMLSHDVETTIWGGYDPHGEVAARAKSMRHPHRIRFMGQTADPQSALSQSRIFFYPLQPDHYGTAENALIEAMSLGLVPVVLANPAECAIVENGVTGFIANSIKDCAAVLDQLLDRPEDVARIGANAAKVTWEKYTPERSADAFFALWSSLLAEPKHAHDFASATGKTPLDWYLATQMLPGEEIDVADGPASLSKGTVAHFKSAFPDDPCWQS